MDAPLVLLVAIAASGAVGFAAWSWRFRRGSNPSESRVVFPMEKAVADPLSGLWTDLNHLVMEDPRLDYALTDLDRVVALVFPPAPPEIVSVVGALDVEAVLAEMRARASTNPFRPWMGLQEPDPLRAYLEGLEERTAVPEPMFAGR